MSGEGQIRMHECLDKGNFERSSVRTKATLNAEKSDHDHMFVRYGIANFGTFKFAFLRFNEHHWRQLQLWTQESLGKVNPERTTVCTKATFNARISAQKTLWTHECLDKGNFDCKKVWTKANLIARISGQMQLWAH